MKRILALIALIAALLPFSVHAQATNVQLRWATYFYTRVTWVKSTQDTRSCIYKYDALNNSFAFLDCTTGNVYDKKETGVDTRYEMRQNDRLCILEYKNNTQLGELVCSNGLDMNSRPPKYVIVMPIVVR